MELQEYRDRIELTLPELVAQGQTILQFELTNFDMEDGVIVAAYEVWLDGSYESPFGSIFHESTAFLFEVENILPGEGLTYSHWNDGFSSEESILGDAVPSDVLDAWIDLNTEEIYCYFADRQEELPSCPPAIASAFWSGVKGRESTESTVSVSGAKQNGRLATGMFSAGF